MCLKEDSVQGTTPSSSYLFLNIANPLTFILTLAVSASSYLLLPSVKPCRSTPESPCPFLATGRGAVKPCSQSPSSCNRQSQHMSSQAPEPPLPVQIFLSSLHPPTLSVQPEFWGPSSDPLSCQPCDCDLGDAYSNRYKAGPGMDQMARIRC